jgi:hypothetical protein
MTIWAFARVFQEVRRERQKGEPWLQSKGPRLAVAGNLGPEQVIRLQVYRGQDGQTSLIPALSLLRATSLSAIAHVDRLHFP